MKAEKFSKKIYCSLLGLSICLMAPTEAEAIGWFGTSIDGIQCDGNPQSHGPYDYIEIINSTDKTLVENARLWEVDKIHYGRASERLRNGLNPITINLAWGDYDYTLRAFPNHVLALRDIITLEIERLKANKKGEYNFSAFSTPPECYLQRAEKYRPNQEHIPLLHGIYLYRVGKYKEAETQYRKAIGINPENAESHYNLGLLLVRMKRPDDALVHAQKAYSLKYPLDSLKQQLIDAGVWKNTDESTPLNSKKKP